MLNIVDMSLWLHRNMSMVYVMFEEVTFQSLIGSDDFCQGN